MQCPSCGHENREGRKFCSECASPLFTELKCPSCGALNEHGEKYCGGCAASLTVIEPESAQQPKTVSPPSQPSSFASGRYHVQKFLGEGGKKRVYLAHDSVLDRDVALAVIKTEGLDEVSRLRVTREAQAMGRLGDHPHILPIHDLGEENGQPYMVLPVMSGGDAQGVIEKVEDHRLPLEEAIELAMQVCRGLEHGHSHGIVHRDLKPGNVWLTSEGTAKIGDFGLAVVMDRSRLTQEGMMVGTSTLTLHLPLP